MSEDEVGRRISQKKKKESEKGVGRRSRKKKKSGEEEVGRRRS